MKFQGENMNGFQKPFYVSISIILMLVATLWAITWQSASHQINRQQEAIDKINTFIAQQQIYNENQEKLNKKFERLLEIGCRN